AVIDITDVRGCYSTARIVARDVSVIVIYKLGDA
ncbi:MAG: hypothetical protein ACI96P_000617, partial [Candidatus Azotimanducaceae bacterium]